MYYVISQTVTGWHCWSAASVHEFIDVVFHTSGTLATSADEARDIDQKGTTFHSVQIVYDEDDAANLATQVPPAAYAAFMAEYSARNIF